MEGIRFAIRSGIFIHALRYITKWRMELVFGIIVTYLDEK